MNNLSKFDDDFCFQEAYDFARCQRPDGTFYGTSGTCRKGTPVGPREKKALKAAAKKGNKRAKAALDVVEGRTTIKSMSPELKKELVALAPTKSASQEGDAKKLGKKYDSAKKKLGEGSYGAVKETKDGTVVKKGYIGKDEIEIQKRLADVEGVPKIIDYAYTSKPFADRNGDRMGLVEMEKAKGGSLDMQMLRMRMDDEFTPAVATKMTDNYISLRKQLHTRGVAHGDMHEGNVTWDGNKMGVIDFGLSKPSYTAALNEALGTFSSASGSFGGKPVGDVRSQFLIDDMRRDGAKSRRADALERKVATIQKKASSGTLSEKRAQQLLEELYDGI